MLPDPSYSDGQVPLPALLHRLKNAIASLPDSVPAGNNTDVFSAFALDPRLCLEPGQDPWEDLVHEVFDALLWQRTTIDLSHLVRRGSSIQLLYVKNDCNFLFWSAGDGRRGGGFVSP